MDYSRLENLKENAVCFECMWFDDINISCVAFPLGIPLKYTRDGAKHDKPDKDQIVDAVFTPKESKH